MRNRGRVLAHTMPKRAHTPCSASPFCALDHLLLLQHAPWQSLLRDDAGDEMQQETRRACVGRVKQRRAGGRARSVRNGRGGGSEALEANEWGSFAPVGVGEGGGRRGVPNPA